MYTQVYIEHMCVHYIKDLRLFGTRMSMNVCVKGRMMFVKNTGWNDKIVPLEKRT